MRRAAFPLCLLCLVAIATRGGAPARGAEDDAPAPPQSSHGAHVPGHAAADTRAPLPLTAMMAEHQKTNMRDHLAAVQEIVAALAADDLVAVEKAVGRIGHSERMAQMCEHMGAGAPGFTAMALAFHRTADTIGDAARRGDGAAATAALAATLGACVGCHAAYRQEVVDDATWQRLATDAPQGR